MKIGDIGALDSVIMYTENCSFKFYAPSMTPSILTQDTLTAIVRELAIHLRKQDFLTYFKRISLLTVKDNILTIGVSSAFLRDNILQKFHTELLVSVQKVLPDIAGIRIDVDNHLDSLDHPTAIDCHKVQKHVAAEKRQEDSMGGPMVEGINARAINDKYRLENFIVGPSNELAFAAAKAVVNRIGSAYNPLYIHSDVGLGKTHLLQAIGNGIRARYKDKKVIYTTADRFLSDYVTAVRNRKTEGMMNKYRAIDCLIIDDVQFLAGKQQTQNELYNIFNLLHEAGKQIVLSGDRAPKELTELEPRLRSRFGMGMMVDISVPDFETRLAIVQQKAHDKQFMISQDVGEFIAKHADANVREIEGVLNQIIAEYELSHTPPTMENVARRMNKLAMTETLLGNRTKAPTLKHYQDLLDAVATHFGLESKNITGNDRRKEYMIPRQVAMYLLKNRLNYTYDRIGNIFNGRNHTAVIYSCKKLETVMKKDQQLHYEVNIIRDRLGL